jgi:anti-sigma factor RsiW
MQHHDGELSPREAAEVEELLAGDPVAREALAGLDQLGDFVRRFAEERSSGADDLAAAVMERLDEEPVRASGWHPRPPDVGWVGGRRRWLWGAAGGLAAAAAITLVLSARSSGDAGANAVRLAALGSAARSATAVTHPGPGAGPVAFPPRDLAEPGVSIEAVDFGTRNGTIFMVPAGGEATTPVVWVVDQPSASGGEARPL